MLNIPAFEKSKCFMHGYLSIVIYQLQIWFLVPLINFGWNLFLELFDCSMYVYILGVLAYGFLVFELCVHVCVCEREREIVHVYVYV
jgi:hypothetical protein